MVPGLFKAYVLEVAEGLENLCEDVDAGLRSRLTWVAVDVFAVCVLHGKILGFGGTAGFKASAKQVENTLWKEPN